LSKHVIRAWERRYQAVEPERGPGGRRLYSEQDIERLQLLQQAVDQGHRIGSIASQPTEELRRLIARTPMANAVGRPTGPRTSRAGQAGGSAPSKDSLVAQGYSAAKNLESRSLEEVLEQAISTHGSIAVDEGYIFPLVKRVSEAWKRGELTVAHQQLVTTHMRAYLESRLRETISPNDAPAVIVTTPRGEESEVGILAAAGQAEHVGWRPVYLGPETPSEALASAVRQSEAQAVLMSIVTAAWDDQFEEELVRLREQVPHSVPILVGGRLSPERKERLRELDFVVLHDMQGLRQYLQARSA
jgi:DNA-binding transcriptional MerR regulator/methylmalonyl-CoA mutase cobalamin-binding subunit